MQTSVTELPGSRVRVEVEVPGADVERGVQRAARGLAREMRLPGFRKGKAPPALVIQRVGYGAVLEEAIRDSLPEWYERALLGSGRQPGRRPERRDRLRARRPRAIRSPSSSRSACARSRSSASTGASRSAGPSPRSPEDIVDREMERVREGFAKLEPVERAAAEGDVLLIDFEGLVDGQAFEGGKASDYLLELGSGQLIEGFEDQLTGASAGESREVEVTFPDEYQSGAAWPARRRSSRSR